MTTDYNDIDRLYEALTIEGKSVDAVMPSFYYRGRMSTGWYGKLDRPDVMYKNSEGLLHRLYGPAYISGNFNITEWYKEGELHRLDGPAYQHNDNKLWYKDGKLHRLDGPAVDMKGHPKEYWIGGQRLSPKNYKKEIDRRKRKGLIK